MRCQTQITGLQNAKTPSLQSVYLKPSKHFNMLKNTFHAHKNPYYRKCYTTQSKEHKSSIVHSLERKTPALFNFSIVNYYIALSSSLANYLFWEYHHGNYNIIVKAVASPAEKRNFPLFSKKIMMHNRSAFLVFFFNLLSFFKILHEMVLSCKR